MGDQVLYNLAQAASNVPSDNEAISWFAAGAVVIGLLLLISAFFNRRK